MARYSVETKISSRILMLLRIEMMTENFGVTVFNNGNTRNTRKFGHG